MDGQKVESDDDRSCVRSSYVEWRRWYDVSGVDYESTPDTAKPKACLPERQCRQGFRRMNRRIQPMAGRRESAVPSGIDWKSTPGTTKPKGFRRVSRRIYSMAGRMAKVGLISGIDYESTPDTAKPKACLPERQRRQGFRRMSRRIHPMEGRRESAVPSGIDWKSTPGTTKTRRVSRLGQSN